MWRRVAAIYGVSIGRILRDKIGDCVYSGPFKGMKLTPCMLSGLFAPHLLGCYEHELHRTVERVIASPYTTILNIGCSNGYYSIGLALRMPQATVHAFDTDEKAQNGCRDMAALNGVANRVQIGGAFDGEGFARFAGTGTLLLMDIEGAEQHLLDPASWPALQTMDIIVELHECNTAGITQTITDRFAATHDIVIVRNRSIHFPLESLLGDDVYLDHFDNMVVTFEGRAGPTPWAVMRRKK